MTSRVYTSVDTMRYTTDILSQRRNERGLMLRSGVAPLDKYMMPWLPGELIIVLAYTSHGKTSLLQAMARSVADQIAAREDEDSVCLYYTWETLVEEIGLYDIAQESNVPATDAWYGDIDDYQVRLIETAAMRLSGRPLWLVGNSISRDRDASPFTIGGAVAAAKSVEVDYKKQIKAVFVDYLQLVPTERGGDRRIQIMEVVDAFRDMGRTHRCPVVIACQAGRQCEDRDFGLPLIGDGQETSRIEQDADKVISLWFPVRSGLLGKPIVEVNATVTRDLLIMGLRKQRRAASGQIFPVRFDAARNSFTWWGSDDGDDTPPARQSRFDDQDEEIPF